MLVLNFSYEKKLSPDDVTYIFLLSCLILIDISDENLIYAQFLLNYFFLCVDGCIFGVLRVGIGQINYFFSYGGQIFAHITHEGVKVIVTAPMTRL